MADDIDFTAYIPEAVREYWHDPDLDGIRAEDRACLRLLIEDSEMKLVYEKLATSFRREFDASDKYSKGVDVDKHVGIRTVQFLFCAWSANGVSFESKRGERKSISTQLTNIANAAEKLATQLTHLSRSDLLREFYPSLGDLLIRRWPLPEWGVSPDCSQLLRILATACENSQKFRGERSMVGAALVSQQTNQTTEYLRAFIHLLRFVRHIRMTQEVMHAVATTAGVVDEQHLNATYDDVRKAFKLLGGNPPEDWPSA